MLFALAMYPSLQIITLSEINASLESYPYAYFETKPNRLKSYLLYSGTGGNTGQTVLVHYQDCGVLDLKESIVTSNSYARDHSAEISIRQ